MLLFSEKKTYFAQRSFYFQKTCLYLYNFTSRKIAPIQTRFIKEMEAQEVTRMEVFIQDTSKFTFKQQENLDVEKIMSYMP